MKPLWKRCVESTDELLGEALGKEYVEKYFPPEAKARMQEMVQNLRLAMGETIEGLDWMSPETKKRFNVEDDLEQIGRPVDRGRWGMTPPTSNAYYNPLLNEIVFPAGILVPPAFSMQANDAQLCSIGVIGREFVRLRRPGPSTTRRAVPQSGPTRTSRSSRREPPAPDQFEGYFVSRAPPTGLVLGEHRRSGWGEDRVLGLQIAARQPPLRRSTASRRPAVLHRAGRSGMTRPGLSWRMMVQGDPHPIGRDRAGLNRPVPKGVGRPSQMVRSGTKRCEVW
jgi:endothelin-converting enzyme/putative endopeptidase